MSDKLVKIKSMSRGTVGITVPYLSLRRTWARKGAVQQLPMDVLKEAIYEPGVEYLFKTGMLSIESLEDRIELGLEEPGTTEETAKLVSLSQEELIRLVKEASYDEFKEKLEKLTRPQALELAEVAIDQEITDYSKGRLIYNKTGRDVFKIVTTKKEEEEAEKEKERVVNEED